MRIPLSVKEIEIRGNGRGGLANRKEAPEEDPFSSLAADPSLKIDASLPRVVSSLLAFHPIVFLLFGEGAGVAREYGRQWTATGKTWLVQKARRNCRTRSGCRPFPRCTATPLGGLLVSCTPTTRLL